MPENKLQIRAKILSSIINLQNNNTDLSFVGNTLDELNAIQDKDAILDILYKEFLKENSELRDYTITFLIGELIEKEKTEKVLFETLANTKINDKIKAKAVNFLRELGKHVNYEQYLEYFENPDDVIDSDTTKLLENAKINPESQIDFLDFVQSLPEQEKEMLINSLKEDYDGDNLANILSPLIISAPYSDIAQIAIKALGESRSMLAYPVLKQIEEQVEDLAIKSLVQKSLTLLKLSGIKEDNTPSYYKTLLQMSPIYKCYVNYPDGHGNIGIIFSRKQESSLIQMFSVVLNDIDGIIDCFGFNEISDTEFERIVNKFYQNDNVTEVSPKFCKYLMVNAEKISRLKYKEFSYEYAAWSMITKDIEYVDINLEENLKHINLSDLLLKQIYEKNYLEKWFLDVSHNEDFKALIEEILDKKTSNIAEIEEIAFAHKPKIFSATFIQILNYRLLLTAYLANKNQNTFDNLFYSLREGSETKDKFLSDILKKSIYEYFLSKKEHYENLKKATSIFTRKANKDVQELDIEYIKVCIQEIEKAWS